MKNSNKNISIVNLFLIACVVYMLLKTLTKIEFNANDGPSPYTLCYQGLSKGTCPNECNDFNYEQFESLLNPSMVIQSDEFTNDDAMQQFELCKSM